jgi:hypothetical protein
MKPIIRTAPLKTSQLHVFVTEAESAMVVQLATAAGKTRSEFVRDLVRREHARAHAEEHAR